MKGSLGLLVTCRYHGDIKEHLELIQLQSKLPCHDSRAVLVWEPLAALWTNSILHVFRRATTFPTRTGEDHDLVLLKSWSVLKATLPSLKEEVANSLFHHNWNYTYAQPTSNLIDKFDWKRLGKPCTYILYKDSTDFSNTRHVLQCLMVLLLYTS